MKNITNEQKIALFLQMEKALWDLDNEMIYSKAKYFCFLESIMIICSVLGKDKEFVYCSFPSGDASGWGIETIKHNFAIFIFTQINDDDRLGILSNIIYYSTGHFAAQDPTFFHYGREYLSNLP